MMNIAAVRSRSSYRRLSPRYGRNSNRNIILKMIFRQLVLSILILLIISIVKKIDTPFTNYIVEGIRYSVVQNYEITYVYQGIDKLLNNLPLNGNGTKKDTEFEQEAVPASKDVSPTESVIGSYMLEDTVPDEDENVKDEAKTEAKAESKTEAKIEQKGPYFILPAMGKIGSDFGERNDPFTKIIKVHKGIDIEAANGTPVKAALGGTVTEAGYEKTFGNYIKINHPDGFSTLYAHCSSLNAKKGQAVKQGDVIAKVGNTGASMGYHVHFELRKNGTPVNPVLYLSSAGG